MNSTTSPAVSAAVGHGQMHEISDIQWMLAVHGDGQNHRRQRAVHSESKDRDFDYTHPTRTEVADARPSGVNDAAGTGEQKIVAYGSSELRP